MGSMVEYPRAGGKTAHGYLALPPGGGNAPGVVMFEEWWGVNDQMKQTADRLAGDGFAVLVPDLFHGKVAQDRETAGHMMQGLDFGDAATAEAPAAATYLRDHGSKRVAVMGFCMGGAVAILAAMHAPGFDAAVTFYGNPPPEAGDPSKIGIPVMGHWGVHDEFFTMDAVDELEKKLHAGNVPHEFHRYEAKHGFYNPGGLGNYHRESAETAWRRTVEFLRRALT